VAAEAGDASVQVRGGEPEAGMAKRRQMAATMMIPEDGNAPSTFCRFASRGESSFPMFSLWRFID